MTPAQVAEEKPRSVVSAKEMKVDPMWSADEEDPRAAIIRRASDGEKKALRGN